MASSDDPAKLVASLRLVFRDQRKEGNPELFLQSQYFVALWRIARFLENMNASDVAIKIDQLAAGISRLKYGIESAGLRRSKVVGSRIEPDEVAIAQTYAVLGVKCLILAGMEESDAADHALKKYGDIAKLARRGSTKTPKTALLNWLSRHEKGEFKNPVGREIYEENLRIHAIMQIALKLGQIDRNHLMLEADRALKSAAKGARGLPKI
jgi:hypothetical protein